MEELVKFLVSMKTDIETLKAWKAEQDNRIKEEEEQQKFAQAEFDKFIAQRRGEEAKRAADEKRLREKMI